MTTDSGQVFGERFRAGLLDLSKRIGRLVPVLDKQFSAVLQEQSVLPQQVQLLARITPGAVARTLRPDPEPLAFFGRVQEAGLELAQWNFPPEGLIASLRQYESLLNASPIELADLDWVREQLNFCTLLTLNDAYYRVRETETRKLQELFQIETDAKDEASLWQPYLESLVTYCGADAASFHVPSRDGDLRCVARVGKPEAKSTPSRRKSKTRLNSLNPHWSGRYESVWLVSLNDGPAGPRAQLEMAFRSERAFLPRERSMLENAGQRFLRSAHRLQLIADLADRERKLLQLADHMVQVEENERRRISRELHDEAGQSLACIRLQLELVGMNLPATYKEIREQLNETREITERTILDMRRLISDLSPVVLDQFGLAAAIRQLCKRLEASSGIKMTLKLEPIPEITRKLQMVIYRIVQECCNNVAKHSRASNVNISLRSADEIIELRVADNGVGFDATKVDQKTDSYGLSGIRERVALLGGRFSIVSTPRSVRKKGRYGTEVLVEVPTSSEVIRKNI